MQYRKKKEQIAFEVIEDAIGGDAVAINQIIDYFQPYINSRCRRSNRYYGYTAKETLDFTQSLYEKKLVTYPRTDSQYLTEDMEQTARQVIAMASEKYGFSSVYPLEPDVKRTMLRSTASGM